MVSLREAFQASGFGLVQRHAELASEICDYEFTSEAFLLEGDAQTQFLMERKAAPQASIPMPLMPLRDAYEERLRRMSRSEKHAKFYCVLEAQKLDEMDHLSDASEEIVIKKSAMRKFSETVGRMNGFDRSKTKLRPVSSAMKKVMPRSGLVGLYGVDAGGLSTALGGPPLPIVMRFFVTRGVSAEYPREVALDRIVFGSGYYNIYSGAIDPYAADRLIYQIPEIFWSNMVKLGILASIKLFDLFLESADRDLSLH